MKGLIIYKGKYGATEQYANWLSHNLNMPALLPDQLTNSQLAATDVLILGTSVYIGKFQLRDWLHQNASIISSKKLFLYMVSGTPLHEKNKLESFVEANVPADLRSKMEIFFLPGKLDKEHLSWLDSVMLRMGAALTKDAAQKKRMLTDYNDVKQEHLTRLIHAVENYDQAIVKMNHQPY
jgi:menaquinone-dependent protoporphyrinogen IX oxidase